MRWPDRSRSQQPYGSSDQKLVIGKSVRKERPPRTPSQCSGEQLVYCVAWYLWRATPKRRNPRRSMAPASTRRTLGPYPFHTTSPRSTQGEWIPFPSGMYSVNRTPRMGVETEPIHFTQDDHHSIQERPTHDAP